GSDERPNRARQGGKGGGTGFRGVGGQGAADEETISSGVAVTLPPPGLDRLRRRLSRDEAAAAVADEVRPARLNQSLPHLEVVLRLEELHQRPLHLAVAQVL